MCPSPYITVACKGEEIRQCLHIEYTGLIFFFFGMTYGSLITVVSKEAAAFSF